LHRFQIARDRGVDAGLHLARHRLSAGKEAPAPGARRVVAIPVEAFDENDALRRRQAQRMDVGDVERKGRELRAFRGQAELGRLLHRVDGVGAAIGERHDLGARGLRLQQVGGEVAGVERVLHRAKHLAAGIADRALGIALHGRAKGEIGGDEEPAVIALGDEGAQWTWDTYAVAVAPVRSALPEVEVSERRPSWRASSWTPSATAELARSTMTATCSFSNQRRAMPRPTSGLFWRSASIASTDPSPESVENGPLSSVSTPIRSFSSASAAEAAALASTPAITKAIMTMLIRMLPSRVPP